MMMSEDIAFGDGIEPWQRAMMSQMKPHQYLGKVARSPWYPEPKQSSIKAGENDED
jgi:hypothetical protein